MSFALLTVAIVQPVCLLIVRGERVKTSLRVIGGWWKPGRNKEAKQLFDYPDTALWLPFLFCNHKKKRCSLSSALRFFFFFYLAVAQSAPFKGLKLTSSSERGKDQENPENNRQRGRGLRKTGKAEDMWTYRLADCRWQKRADKGWGGKAEMAADDPLAWHVILRVQAPATSPSKQLRPKPD